MKTTPLFVGDENGLRDVTMQDARSVRHDSQHDAAFGRQMKLRRVALDLNQLEFAAELGIHQVTLSRLETGSSPLTAAMRTKVENTLRRLENQP